MMSITGMCIPFFLVLTKLIMSLCSMVFLYYSFHAHRFDSFVVFFFHCHLISGAKVVINSNLYIVAVGQDLCFLNVELFFPMSFLFS